MSAQQQQAMRLRRLREQAAMLHDLDALHEQALRSPASIAWRLAGLIITRIQRESRHG